MFDYYYGEIVEVKDNRTVYVNSCDFYVEHLEVMLPCVMSRKPKVGDMIEYAYSYDARQVRFGIFIRFENEPTVYLEDLINESRH